MTVPEFTERFGPSQKDYDAVVRFAKASGFKIIGGSRDAMDIRLQGRVGDIEKALHVTMGVYQHPTENRTYYSPDREPTIDLPFQLWHVSGLDNYSIPRPMVKKRDAQSQAQPEATTGSCPQQSFCGSDMRAAYYGSGPLNGAGQNVGLLEYLGYDIADVNTYYTNAGTDPHCRGRRHFGGRHERALRLALRRYRTNIGHHASGRHGSQPGHDLRLRGIDRHRASERDVHRHSAACAAERFVDMDSIAGRGQPVLPEDGGTGADVFHGLWRRRLLYGIGTLAGELPVRGIRRRNGPGDKWCRWPLGIGNGLGRRWRRLWIERTNSCVAATSGRSHDGQQRINAIPQRS